MLLEQREILPKFEAGGQPHKGALREDVEMLLIMYLEVSRFPSLASLPTPKFTLRADAVEF